MEIRIVEDKASFNNVSFGLGIIRDKEMMDGRDRNSVFGMQPNITLLAPFFFGFSSSGCGSSSPSRGDGMAVTRAFGSVVRMVGETASDDRNDAASDAAATIARWGKGEGMVVLVVLRRPLLRDDVAFCFFALEDDGTNHPLSSWAIHVEI